MPVCANCGHETAKAFKFCPECGAPAAVETPSREQRKTVTVLFCDVTGSTALGESTDPEALRGLLARYFERMNEIVQSHGGTVEKFIGDAVMAVFGVPQVHEDDAIRACRAALEMQDALPELGVQARIGLNTGEVVTGTEERLATGDAVNVAARLEQAASPGEILIGEETLRLVRDATETEPVEPLDLKGKAEPVLAYRLAAVHEMPERVHETRFVGRVEELESLRRDWQRVHDEDHCELVTVIGDAGVGKSRLVTEFLARVDATVVHGRCLPYGEGITYWPVVEVLKQLDGLPSNPAAAASLHAMLGESGQATSAEEIAWAFRKLLEERSPLVCVFDDIQWGEETFLDLVEGLALLSTAPLLVLCMARPELVDRRPQWPVMLRLEPLAEPDLDELLPETLGEDLRERIRRASGGNPLFVTEMVAMASETDGQVVVPPTLRALLATRLDQLDTAERSVLERAAVEGEIFHRRSVQALSRDGQVGPLLASLVRKGLIRTDKPLFPGDDAFRFRHLLIRDAAYEALPKATRAELHERFAELLEQSGGDLVELDELVGYHLEQAARYAAELGRPDAALARHAADHLARAGRQALRRVDEPAAASLLERALELTRPLGVDVALELDLAEVFIIGDPQRAAELAESAADRARATGDEAGEALARVVVATRRLFFDPHADVDELEKLARAALPLLERAGDHAGLARVWESLAFGVANTRGRYAEMLEASERAARYHRLAGGPEPGFGALALVVGPVPADEALRKFDAAVPENPGPPVMLLRAVLLAMLSRFDEAWPLAYEANELLRALRGGIEEFWLAEIARYEGEYEAAERHLRAAYEAAEAQGSTVSGHAPALARVLCALGRHQEADPLARRGREVAAKGDVWAQMMWRQAQALVNAHGGDYLEAERLVREAVAIGEQTDALNMQGDALYDLAEVLRAGRRTEEAGTALEQALDRYERKKNLAMVAQVRPRLEELRAGVPDPR